MNNGNSQSSIAIDQGLPGVISQIGKMHTQNLDTNTALYWPHRNTFFPTVLSVRAVVLVQDTAMRRTAITHDRLLSTESLCFYKFLVFRLYLKGVTTLVITG